MFGSYSKKGLALSLVAAGGLTIAGLGSYAGAAGKYYHEIQVVEHAAMLVEKMAKDAALIALHIDEGASRKEMAESRDEFARILNGLRNGDAELNLDGNYKEPELQKDLDLIVQIWPTVDKEVDEALATAEPTRELIERFETHDEELYQAMERLEKHFVEMAKTGEMPSVFAEGIELTEHQATLIERMSKEYFLIAYGFHTDEMRAELKESMAEFEENMKGLIEGDMAEMLLPAPLPEIEARLKKVAKMYKPFGQTLEPALEGTKPTTESLEKVARDNLPLVDEIEKAAKVYETL